MIKSKPNYEFYYLNYNNGHDGTLSKDNFDLYIAKAWRELESRLTKEYTQEQENAVFLTVCELAEEICRYDSKRGIKGENIDGYSITYSDDADTCKYIRDIITRRLGDTGLLYLGV